MPLYSGQELDQMLHREVGDLDPKSRRFWDLIRLEPEKWINTADDDMRQFWAVGLIGKRVLWFEHVELGWCVSPFTRYGYIDEYHTDTSELSHEINRLIAFIEGDEDWREWLRL